MALRARRINSFFKSLCAVASWDLEFWVSLTFFKIQEPGNFFDLMVSIDSKTTLPTDSKLITSKIDCRDCYWFQTSSPGFGQFFMTKISSTSWKLLWSDDSNQFKTNDIADWFKTDDIAEIIQTWWQCRAYQPFWQRFGWYWFRISSPWFGQFIMTKISSISWKLLWSDVSNQFKDSIANWFKTDDVADWFWQRFGWY